MAPWWLYGAAIASWLIVLLLCIWRLIPALRRDAAERRAKKRYHARIRSDAATHEPNQGTDGREG